MKIEDILIATAAHLRAMQLSYHKQHNLATGPSFSSDHQLFSDFYNDVEGDYDSFVEHAIGFGFDEVADPSEQLDSIKAALSLDNTALEEQLCALCDMVEEDPICTDGFEQLLGDICRHSEVRSYKLRQRSK